MEENYDAIILGTGLKEGIISALLSVSGKRVLHIDRNDYYGGECASLQLDKLYQFFDRYDTPKPEYGKSREYSIDLVPKFMLSEGKLLKVLRHANCLHYLNFAVISGQFVVRDGVIHRVPVTYDAARASKLMPFSEKVSMAAMLSFVYDWCATPRKSHKCKCSKSPYEATTAEFFNAYKLSPGTQEFIGHAMALWLDDSYLQRPAAETLERINLYADSLFRFEPYCSSYIYPLYGIGDLPQAFARCCAVWGGTYMLSKPVDEILYAADGKVKGIRSGPECAYAPIVIGDPSYFPSLVMKVNTIGRGIFLLKSPIKDCVKLLETKNNFGTQHTSAQVIITASQIGDPRRTSDIYVTTLGSQHNICPRHTCLGFVSGYVDDNRPVGPEHDHRDQLAAGFEVIKGGDILETFYKEDNMMVPIDKNSQRACGIYVTSSLDPTSHFETTVTDAIEIFESIMGAPIDWSKPVRPPVLNENGEIEDAPAEVEEEEDEADEKKEEDGLPEDMDLEELAAKVLSE